ncbi:MAG: ParA family protein [Gallionella sp.]|nr:ParA family protein [Gallionella sp.]
MQAILIANPKGGSGKTTLSTNIAGYLATQGKRVAMLDMDRQKSASQWLASRSVDLPEITLLQEQKSAGRADWLVIDSPAGLHGKNLEHALRIADLVVVPIAPSLFDIQASYDFLKSLNREKTVQKKRVEVGVVGMRMDPRTRAALTLEQFLAAQEMPVLAYLRETQAYVNAAFEGKTLFDLPAYLAERELEQWTYLLRWLNEHGAQTHHKK